MVLKRSFKTTEFKPELMKQAYFSLQELWVFGYAVLFRDNLK
jgi:hypothetical protein